MSLIADERQFGDVTNQLLIKLKFNFLGRIKILSNCKKFLNEIIVFFKSILKLNILAQLWKVNLKNNCAQILQAFCEVGASFIFLYSYF